MQNNKNVPLHIIKDEEHPYTSSGKNSSFLTSSHHGGYNSGNGGGGNMDDHVTHRELDKAADSLQKDIKLSQDETSNQITELSGKIDALSVNIRNLSKISWWIMTIISAGIIVPFVILLIKTIFKL
ncbi:hypothetical protein [Lentilactobacillus parabuchneri]|uniref:hypothetical protein n=1 Tax=Lentilactobacillus parabuchneri TaxID=152331 RepID=UPI0009472E08|nr:hypothetical protein [Lentilactobacillus parabuchneri]APR08278.1 hypothetical protein FAM21731_02141 [Lentilactobacillus parabuchneri]